MAIEIYFKKNETIGQGIARTLAENNIPTSPKGLVIETSAGTFSPATSQRPCLTWAAVRSGSSFYIGCRVSDPDGFSQEVFYEGHSVFVPNVPKQQPKPPRIPVQCPNCGQYDCDGECYE